MWLRREAPPLRPVAIPRSTRVLSEVSHASVPTITGLLTDWNGQTCPGTPIRATCTGLNDIGAACNVIGALLGPGGGTPTDGGGSHRVRPRSHWRIRRYGNFDRGTPVETFLFSHEYTLQRTKVGGVCQDSQPGETEWHSIHRQIASVAKDREP